MDDSRYYDEACEYILSVRPTRDARDWFRNATSHRPHTIFEFSVEATRDILDSIDACAPLRVRVLGEEGARQCNVSCDAIIIDLPANKANRSQLFELSAKIAAEGGFMPDPDVGQKYMLLRWT